jgi:predicted nucleic acid-binding protein
MNVADTSILSSFAAADALPLLLKALRVDALFIAPAVYKEISVGLAEGYEHLQVLQTAVESHQLEILPLTELETVTGSRLPASLGQGERESIVLAERLAANLLSSDKKVITYCKQHQVRHADLFALLSRSQKVL